SSFRSQRKNPDKQCQWPAVSSQWSVLRLIIGRIRPIRPISSSAPVTPQREPSINRYHLSGDIVVRFQQQPHHPRDILWSAESWNDLLLNIKVILSRLY